MDRLCEGRVVIVTGAGRGIGRAHALAFATEGAKVVVNDIGAELDGTGGSPSPAREVADEIEAAGGSAVVNGDDVADWDGAQRLVATAVETFGQLDVVVNNAGVVRDRMFFNATDDEWDAVLRVHLKGHFCVGRWAASYWRDQAKAGNRPDARIVNTTSGAGLQGSVGQAAYSAAKGGIATLTLVQAAELGRYGITANAIAPSARTRMTETVFADKMAAPDGPARPRPHPHMASAPPRPQRPDDAPGAFDAMAPENIAPLVVWLGSSQSAHVTGRVFEVEGGKLSVADGWQPGPGFDKGARWNPPDVGPVVDDLLAKTPAPAPVYGTQ
jgi:NAD(P)-dependent dehydrogenase (short-subunit alcohol dehydrogenase family)